MRNVTAFIILSIALGVSVLAQDGESPRYDNSKEGPAAGSKGGGTVFYEDFVDNRRSWLGLASNWGIWGIIDGGYVIERSGPGYNYSGKNFAVGFEDDFTASLTTKKLYGVDNFGYGLYWGLKDADNFYSFCIFGDGGIKVIKFAAGQEKILVPYEKSTAVKMQNSLNRLRVQKRGNTVLFFVNDVIVAKDEAGTLSGSHFGFMVFNKQTILFDDLLITKP